MFVTVWYGFFNIIRLITDISNKKKCLKFTYKILCFRHKKAKKKKGKKKKKKLKKRKRGKHKKNKNENESDSSGGDDTTDDESESESDEKGWKYFSLWKLCLFKLWIHN